MRPEESEKLLIEDLFMKTVDQGLIPPVAELRIDRLAGDASTRRYYRVEAGQSSYVVCLDDPMTDKESPFLVLQSVLERNGVSVPKVIDRNLARGYILEEDLGDQTLLKRLAYVNGPEEELSLYTVAIDELIRIHSIDCSKYRGMEFTKLKFDTEKLFSECVFTVNWFIKKFLKHELDANTERDILGGLKSICERLAMMPMVLTHRDYHSRNIMLMDGRQVVIDFQDARLGLPQYDLASILEDCYYRLPEPAISKLKEHYWNSFLAGTKTQSKDEFETYYKLMAIQRVFKACGSFAYIHGLRGDLRYVKYIGYGMERVRLLMSEFPELSKARKALFKVYYEN